MYGGVRPSVRPSRPEVVDGRDCDCDGLGIIIRTIDYIRIQCATPTCVREVTRVKDRDDREDDDDDVNEDDDVRDDDDGGGGERRRERRRARCTQQGSTRERAW